MIACKQITVPLKNGYAQLMFKQYEPNGDWICVASNECLTDLKNLSFNLEKHTNDYH